MHKCKLPAIRKRGDNNYTLVPKVAMLCDSLFLYTENDQCRLTAITSGDIYRVTEECQCLCDYFLMNRAPTEPNESYKLNAPSDDQHQQEVGLVMLLCDTLMYVFARLTILLL